MTKAASAGLASGDTLLAALSHELRTPLNGVLGMAGLLARTRLDDAQRSYLEALQQSGEHLLGLVNEVLDLAKIESSGFELNTAPLDVERLLQGATELLSPRAHAKGLEIAWACAPGLPGVIADEARLRQVLFNLAGNAVKFTETGGVLITAAARAGEDGRVRLRFSVRDTGPGVSPEDRERIFEPFAQGPAAAAGMIESTGLGLAIVRRLAEAMSARLGVDNPPGGGADFWFEAEFPRADEVGADRPLEGLTVAIVSANPVVAEAAALQVEASGGHALRFATAREAQAATEAAPESAVVLIDYPLAARRRPQPIEGRRCIVLLAPEARGRILALRRAGFDGYLIKPLRRQSLAVRVLAVRSPPTRRRASTPADDERATVAAGAGARVLLAEDNPINAILARALLEREGCVVERVQSGPEAVQAASAQNYDLILLDLRMPGLGGLEAAAELRRRGLRTPIAALTADAFEDTRRACLEAGMDDFLTKPLDAAALRALLGRVLRPDFTGHRRDAKLAS
jgi:CheY-like chemotaxis protein/anti-sigma regulatory factor (Ser/Thr protein kinase)